MRCSARLEGSPERLAAVVGAVPEHGARPHATVIATRRCLCRSAERRSARQLPAQDALRLMSVASLSLTMSDLFPDEGDRSAGAAPIETVYPYVDERRAAVRVTSEERRLERRQEVPALRETRARTGEPIRHAQGVRRVLLNLPQVLAAVTEGRPIVICERREGRENTAWLFESMRGAVTTTEPAWCRASGDRITASVSATLGGHHRR